LSAAARTSAADAVLLLTSTYKGVCRSGREGSFEGTPLGRVCWRAWSVTYRGYKDLGELFGYISNKN
jgi:hypothetical protein